MSTKTSIYTQRKSADSKRRSFSDGRLFDELRQLERKPARIFYVQIVAALHVHFNPEAR